MSNMNKYEKLLYKRNRLKNHCGHQMNKITELQQELQRKDNIINELEKYLNEQYEKTFCEFAFSCWGNTIDKLKELKENK